MEGQEALEQSEARFRALAESASEAVIIHEHGVVREVNSAFSRITGYSRDEILGQSGLATFIHPSSHDSVRRTMSEGVAVVDREVQLVTKAGELRTVLSSSAPIMFQGRLMRVVTALDITDRVRAEEARRRSDALLRAIADNTSQVVVVKDLGGRFLFANRALERLLGHKLGPTEALTDVLPAEAATTVREHDAATAESGSSGTYEEVLPTPEGLRDYLTVRFPIANPDGRVFAVGAIATDVTEQRRVQQVLLRITRGIAGTTGVPLFRAIASLLADAAEAELAFVGELLPGGKRVRTVALHDHGRIVPDVEYDLADTPCEDVVGRALCVHRAGVQGLFPKDLMLGALGIEAYVGIPIQGAKGEPDGILVALRKRPLAHGDSVLRVLEVVAEVMAARAAAEFERLRAARELERINQSLERGIAERTRELEDFASSVSHDLRAPLRHILGFVDLLSTTPTSQRLDDKQRHYLEIIGRSATHMSRMIDALLGLARTGRAGLRRERVALGELVAGAREDLTQANPDRRIDWLVGPLPTVWVDRALFAQVVTNLLDNAVKYTRGRDPARIEVLAEEADGTARLVVRDNGAGFDPRFAGKLFGVFERLHSDSRFEGAGVGLATVRRIVERHGGTVTAVAEPEHGATFVVTLPRAEEPA